MLLEGFFFQPNIGWSWMSSRWFVTCLTSGRQASGKVIQPNLDHLGVTLKPVKCFEGGKKRTAQAFLQEFGPRRNGPRSCFSITLGRSQIPCEIPQHRCWSQSNFMGVSESPWMFRGSFGFLCQVIQLKKKPKKQQPQTLLNWWLQIGALIGQMTTQDLRKRKKLSYWKFSLEPLTGYDLIWFCHIKMMHERNGEGGESKCCE